MVLLSDEWVDDLAAEEVYRELMKSCQHDRWQFVSEDKEIGQELRLCLSGCGETFTVCTWF